MIVMANWNVGLRRIRRMMAMRGGDDGDIKGVKEGMNTTAFNERERERRRGERRRGERRRGREEREEERR
jgi:hypothetical protein